MPLISLRRAGMPRLVLRGNKIQVIDIDFCYPLCYTALSLKPRRRNSMQMNGNTILITGGGSGIGRALAEAFQAEGNQVIIAGRRQEMLDEAVAANPGMKAAVLDIANAGATASFAQQIKADYPALNVVIHNAGIMRTENLLAGQDALADAEATIATNLLGPIRLTAALLPLLQSQPHAAIMTVSSGLAFVPLAMTPTYCATKAAITRTQSRCATSSKTRLCRCLSLCRRMCRRN